jgi:uncharacterized protein
MTGTIIDVAAILVGGILGLTVKGQLSLAHQNWIKHLLGIFTVYFGLSMTWAGLNGTWFQVSKQILITVLSLTLGKAVGRALRLQRGFNRLGQHARKRMTPGDKPPSWSDGFITCSILFCVVPLAILGSLQNGLDGHCRVLLIKSAMDGLTAMAFVRMLGWGTMVSAIPVLAYQGSLTLIAQGIEPFLHQHALLDSINAAAGLVVFSVALVILELKRVELADYLPSLIIAPLFTWFWR